MLRRYVTSIPYQSISLLTPLLDYIKSALSISIASISQLPKSLTSLAPYILLLCIFSAFVIWNGGVVLGKPYFLKSFRKYTQSTIQATKKTISPPSTSLKLSTYGLTSPSFLSPYSTPTSSMPSCRNPRSHQLCELGQPDPAFHTRSSPFPS